MRAYELTEEVRAKMDSPEFQELLTPGLKKIDGIYKKAGKDLRIVGGAVRDLVLGKKPKDIDLASDALPQESLKMLNTAGIKTIETGIEHGTITAIADGEEFEITTLRVDTEHTGRHATVQFTKSWEKDSERRDLTFNSMSLDLDGTLYDYHGGLEDLKADKAKFVGDAGQRMGEDYLRILRYFRFQGRTASPNFDKETVAAIKDNSKGLKKISGERIWMEMAKILSGDHTKAILDMMKVTDVDENIGLPMDNTSIVEKVKQHTENPSTILVSLLKDELDANRLAAHWKFSSPERDLMHFIVVNREKTFNLESAKVMWTNPKVKKDHIAELAYYLGQPGVIEALENWKVSPFPVTGKDLIDAGIKAGPEMGRILKALSDKWKETGYQMSKEKLLRWSKVV